MNRLWIGAVILSVGLGASARTPQPAEPDRSSPAQEAPRPEQRVPDKQQPEKPQTQEPKRPAQENPKPQPPAEQQPQRHRTGGRIPEKQFRTSFGPQHTFRVRQLMSGNRFQAGGFLFEIVEVWPAFWSFDDAFFVDEIDEQFFLFDVNHPGTRILVVVVE
jgi:hypothetical protein